MVIVFQVESLVDVREMSLDEEGNLYVSDFGKHCVHVFSNAGRFLHSFGQNRLREPHRCVCGWPVCVCG